MTVIWTNIEGTGDPEKRRNDRDLTKAEDIKKRWQEYPKELYKKDLYDPIITMV